MKRILSFSQGCGLKYEFSMTVSMLDTDDGRHFIPFTIQSNFWRQRQPADITCS